MHIKFKASIMKEIDSPNTILPILYRAENYPHIYIHVDDFPHVSPPFFCRTTYQKHLDGELRPDNKPSRLTAGSNGPSEQMIPCFALARVPIPENDCNEFVFAHDISFELPSKGRGSAAKQL